MNSASTAYVTCAVGGNTESRYEEIMRVHKYINAHFREPLSVNDLALRFFMDKNTMTRQFKRVIGMTPGEYIRRKRLESAHALIRQGYGVQHAGFVSGFTDYSAFYRAFRQRYGLSPGDLSSRVRSGSLSVTTQEGGDIL